MSINNNNNILNEILETINDLPEAGSGKEEIEKTVDIIKNGETVVTPDDETTTLSRVTVNVSVPEQKEEQEKTVDITENGTTEVTPDEGKALSKVTVNVAIESGGGEDGLESFFAEMRTFTFEGSNTIVKTPLLDCTNLTSLQSAFLNCSNLKEVYVKNTHNVKIWTHAFNSPKIRTIETLDFSSASSIHTSWSGSDYLKNIKIVPNTIKVSIFFCSWDLTVESIQNIIDGLVDLTGQAAQKITLHTTVVGKLTEAQVEQIYLKNWNIG